MWMDGEIPPTPPNKDILPTQHKSCVGALRFRREDRTQSHPHVTNLFANSGSANVKSSDDATANSSVPEIITYKAVNSNIGNLVHQTSFSSTHPLLDANSTSTVKIIRDDTRVLPATVYTPPAAVVDDSTAFQSSGKDNQDTSVRPTLVYTPTAYSNTSLNDDFNFEKQVCLVLSGFVHTSQKLE
jgi:hypothetical protein